MASGRIAFPRNGGEVGADFTFNDTTRIISQADWFNTTGSPAIVEILDSTVLEADGAWTVVRTINIPANPTSGSVNIPTNLGYTFPQKFVPSRYGVRLT